MRSRARRRVGLTLLLAPLALGAKADGEEGEARVRVRAAEAGELGCWLEVERTDGPEERFELLAGPQLCDAERRGGSLEGRVLTVRWRREPWPRCLDCEDLVTVRRLVDVAPARPDPSGTGCGA